MRTLTVGLLLLASVSLAQQPQTIETPAPAQTVTFDNSGVIKGGVDHPTLGIYALPLKRKFDCLIQVRMNFNDKLRESVHEM